MAKGNASNSGCFGIFGVFLILGIIVSIPAGVWLALGIAVLVGLLTWGGIAFYRTSQKDRAARAAAAEQAEAARREQDRRALIDRLGAANVGRLDTAVAAVHQIEKSEAAGEGWLGEVDFAADIEEIAARYERAAELRQTADRLRGLANPNADDQRILAEAQQAATELESTASRMVTLIGNCAAEAWQIDESLRQERVEAHTAQQRAELHGQLSAMLYGIEATPGTPESESAAGRVMARVAGYREIKQQITQTREA